MSTFVQITKSTFMYLQANLHISVNLDLEICGKIYVFGQ